MNKKILLLLGLFAVFLIAGMNNASATNYVNHMHGDYYYSNTVTSNYDSYSERTYSKTPYGSSLRYEKFNYGPYSKYGSYMPYQVTYHHPDYYRPRHDHVYLVKSSDHYYQNKAARYFNYGYEPPRYHSYVVHRSY